jgi:GNAT superfamily N-acetyltransferase
MPGEYMKIVKLSHRNVRAWLDFFDNRAFSDHKAWEGCYCTYYYYPRFEASRKTGRSRREYAKWLIEHNKMSGYLAYDKGKVVGWCNVGPKGNYPKLKGKDPSDEGTKSIVCFTIEAPYRRRGIATALLKRIVKDAKKDGTRRLEAYPNIKAQNPFSHFHGLLSMFLKEGFDIETRGSRTTATLIINAA